MANVHSDVVKALRSADSVATLNELVGSVVGKADSVVTHADMQGQHADAVDALERARETARAARSAMDDADAVRVAYITRLADLNLFGSGPGKIAKGDAAKRAGITGSRVSQIIAARALQNAQRDVVARLKTAASEAGREVTPDQVQHVREVMRDAATGTDGNPTLKGVKAATAKGEEFAALVNVAGGVPAAPAPTVNVDSLQRALDTIERALNADGATIAGEDADRARRIANALAAHASTLKGLATA